MPSPLKDVQCEICHYSTKIIDGPILGNGDSIRTWKCRRCDHTNGMAEAKTTLLRWAHELGFKNPTVLD